MTAIVRQPAPAFECTALVDGEFRRISLEGFRGRYLVLFFYPLDFTFVCPTEILAFNERLSEFHELNAAVVGCSIDSEFVHLAWSRTPQADGGVEGLRLPLLADVNRDVARSYGVLLEEGMAARGLFLIDREGIVRSITIHDLPLGRSVDEALRVLRALRFTEEHGEVCPADWKPGSPTIVPEPDASRSYFSETSRPLED